MTRVPPDAPAPSPVVEDQTAVAEEAAHYHSRLISAVAGLLALLVLGGAALAWSGGLEGQPPRNAPGPSGTAGPGPAADLTVARAESVPRLLAQRARAVLDRDDRAFLATVDPAAEAFRADQRRLIRRLSDVPLESWSYQVIGEGPGLAVDTAAALPDGAAIVRVRLTYRLVGTATDTDREQYVTVLPRGDRWLLAGDTDASSSGFDTQRDVWDLGPVRVVRGQRSLVIGDATGADRSAMRRLAGEADRAVAAVDRLWDREWSRRPMLVLPASQRDMATLIGSEGDGLAQIAAVTTGALQDGLSRGDRVVINPGAFATLGTLGRQVVLSHETTHVATRATGVTPVPIWLSEGFADYVAYDATSIPTAIVASDVLEDVRDGQGPKVLPGAADFDAGEGDIAAAYESAWLACRMIADRYGERRLVRLYAALNDSAGPGWPEETVEVLGITSEQVERQWRRYLADLARQ